MVEYRAKIKLHGSNCAVQVTDRGVVAQHRTSLLAPEADYKGFAAWTRAHDGYDAPSRASASRNGGGIATGLRVARSTNTWTTWPCAAARSSPSAKIATP